MFIMDSDSILSAGKKWKLFFRWTFTPLHLSDRMNKIKTQLNVPFRIWSLGAVKLVTLVGRGFSPTITIWWNICVMLITMLPGPALITACCMNHFGGEHQTYQWFVSSSGSRCTSEIGPIKQGSSLCIPGGSWGFLGILVTQLPLRCLIAIPIRISVIW